MSSITLDNVTKRYGSLTTVDAVSLDIKEGEFLAFLGPSGCGKTTTLRMVGGLTIASEGTVRFGDRDVTDLPPYLRNAGLVFQGYALFPHMTVAQNVAFGLEMRKVEKTQIEKRVADALALVKLGHLADRMPKQLSGGQQQRVALARAIVYEPEVLLLDEPLSALDAKLRHEVRNDLRRLQTELGLTTIFVTHDQDEALAIADRVVVMSAGKVEQIGTPRDIYRRPKTRFVAEFIGLTNIWSGKRNGAGGFQTAAGDSLAMPADGAEGITALALRPEQIRLEAFSEQAQDGNSLSGTVEQVVYRGSLTEFFVKSQSGLQLVVQQQNLETSPEMQPKPGDRVFASWPADATMAF